jgi:glycosyltransferase involved in cell wall biosynthesis
VAHVANLDVALYPRLEDRGIRAVKLAEYMALGVPTVAYAHETTGTLTEHGAGIVVASPREFVEAIALLASDKTRRRTISENARAAGAQFDVRELAHRYEREVLDRYLV